MRLLSAGVAVLIVVTALVGIVPLWEDSRGTGGVGVSGQQLLAPEPASKALEIVQAPTPPMGWNGYNHFFQNVTAATVEAEARALVSSGMKAAGYTYLNLDGGWSLRRRGPGGEILANPQRFPQGILPVAKYVHSLGLKFGIYTSAGTVNCARTSAGSYGHYWQDAATFASWGVDFLKLDWCGIPYKDYPRLSHLQLNELLATQMRDALAATGHRIVYDINDFMGESPWTWAKGLAAVWRTTPDIIDSYPSMLHNFTENVVLYKHAAPSAWNDPDMLEIGNGGMRVAEWRSQFSLWAEMAAPLIAGNDLAAMTPVTLAILTNRAVIAVDQDPLGRQGYAVANAHGHWVLTKAMTGGGRAVVLFNQTNATATISTTAAQVGLLDSSEYVLVDLWTGKAIESTGVIAARVGAHDVVMYLITPGTMRGISS
jgi:alpha-galactosidase